MSDYFASREDPSSATIGWIGLGEQGLALIHRILRTPSPLIVWARRESSYEPLADSRAERAESVAEVGAAADLVGLCVTADRDVLSVAIDGGLIASMKPGSVLAIHATVAPKTCEQIAEFARAYQVHVLDAPVTRDGPSQYDSRFSLLVGGDRAAIDAGGPILRTFVDYVDILGDLGSGQRMKILNNTLMISNVGLLLDALEIGRLLGMDTDAMLDTLSRTSGGSVAVELVPIFAPQPRANYVALLEKDVGAFFRLAEESAASHVTRLPATARSILSDLLLKTTVATESVASGEDSRCDTAK